MFVIYNKKSTIILLARARSVGCYIEHYKSAGAAKGALTRLDKKGQLGDNVDTDPKTFERTVTPYVKEDFAIADSHVFHTTIEKQVTKRNLLSGKEFQQPINTPASCDPSTETYHCM